MGAVTFNHWRIDMTNQELIKKAESCLPNVVENLKQTIARLVKSGAIDVDSATDFCEAKSILCAALRQEVSQWRPLVGETADEKNLMRF